MSSSFTILGITLNTSSASTVLSTAVDSLPNPAATLTLPNGKTLRAGDEVLTFVNRNLEPYRGYHIFMRALPELLRRRPRARVLLVGGNV